MVVTQVDRLEAVTDEEDTDIAIEGAWRSAREGAQRKSIRGVPRRVVAAERIHL